MLVNYSLDEVICINAISEFSPITCYITALLKNIMWLQSHIFVVSSIQFTFIYTGKDPAVMEKHVLSFPRLFSSQHSGTSSWFHLSKDFLSPEMCSLFFFFFFSGKISSGVHANECNQWFAPSCCIFIHEGVSCF